MTGGSQDVFVTGAALAVDSQQNHGFFPDIYNEDWLFFYDTAAAGRLGSSRREVTQLRYDPFDHPQRAAWQEFGDVLAEGLYALLEFGVGIDDAESECWSYFLDSRKRFFDAITRRSAEADSEIRERLLRSVEAARECSAEISPELFERYIWLWRQDLREWEQRISRIRRMPSVDAALQALGLVPSANGRGAAHVARPRSADAAEEPSTVSHDTPGLLRSLHARLGPWADRWPKPSRGFAGNNPVTFQQDFGSRRGNVGRTDTSSESRNR